MILYMKLVCCYKRNDTSLCFLLSTTTTIRLDEIKRLVAIEYNCTDNRVLIDIVIMRNIRKFV